MSEMEFRSLGFEVQYRFTALGDEGDREPDFRFPGGMGTGEVAPDALVVGCDVDNGASWIGSFVHEFDGYPDWIFGCPQPKTAGVVAGGLAWIVDVDDPSSGHTLELVPVVDALGDPETATLFVASLSAVAAFDRSVATVWTTDLGSDGIRFVGLQAGVLSLEVYEPSVGTWVPRDISVADGTLIHMEP